MNVCTTCDYCGFTYDATIKADKNQHEKLHNSNKAWERIYGSSFPSNYKQREALKYAGLELSQSTDITKKIDGAILLIKSHFARSATAGNNTPKNHVDFMKYMQAYIYNLSKQKDSTISDGVISELIKIYGMKQSKNLPINTSYWIV